MEPSLLYVNCVYVLFKRRVCAIDSRTEKGRGKEKGLGYNTTGWIGSIGLAGRQRPQKEPTLPTAYCQKVRECRKKSKKKPRHLQKEKQKKKKRKRWPESDKYLKPFVDALCVILVAAGKNAQRLPRLELTHADDASALAALFDLARKSIRRQLIDLRSS